MGLSDEEKEILWEGGKGFKGINSFFTHLERKKYKIQFRVMLSRYRGRTKCSFARQALETRSSYVKIGEFFMDWWSCL